MNYLSSQIRFGAVVNFVARFVSSRVIGLESLWKAMQLHPDIQASIFPCLVPSR